MLTGIVIGNVVATRKDENLVGFKLLVVEIDQGVDGEKKRIVAVDTVGAGKADKVLCCTGSSARLAVKNTNAPVDAAIIGIIDSLNCQV